jgi:hypothetical protein
MPTAGYGACHTLDGEFTVWPGSLQATHCTRTAGGRDVKEPGAHEANGCEANLPEFHALARGAISAALTLLSPLDPHTNIGQSKTSCFIRRGMHRIDDDVNNS